LNLSDKELDRLSREAAQEHDPGDVLGSRSWEKLEPRLDRDLGKSGPNPLRGVRRFPFYYVPAILLVAGVFYIVKQSHSSKQNEPSGSPPSAKVQSTPTTETQPLSTTQNPEHSLNSTPPATPSAAADPTIANPATVNPAATNRTTAPAAGANPVTPNSATANPAIANSAAPNANASSTTHTTTPTHTSKTTHYPGTTGANNNGTSANSTGTTANNNTTTSTTAAAATTAAATTSAHTTADKTKTGANITNNTARTTHSGRQHRGKNIPSSTTSSTAGANTNAPSPNNIIATVGTTSGAAATSNTSGTNGITNNNSITNNNGANNSAANNNRTANTNNKPRELTLSTIHSSRPQRQHPSISDSALRAYTAKTGPSLIQPGKNKSLRIKRNLQFGLSLAPDFSSVNSLAGDKPGSSFGLTVDYQFANHWYLSTGLLLDRKNYAARQQDYHVPGDFYRMNNMHNVDFVKGSFNMLEIPLNLRYDFSVTGSTLFFASAGFSSYLLTNENCNYYFNWYGREVAKSFSYPNKNNYLFSSINLSLGVETGLSNSMSLLIAPYVKIPSRNIGFGQVQMNSVGINFALKFAPVISRKRK
jgi:hypothetical protein